MAILGGATIPPLYGLMSQSAVFTPQTAYILMVPFYLFIAFYAIRGYKIRKW